MDIPTLSRILKHTILELSHKMDSKNMRHTFETFFFLKSSSGTLCVVFVNVKVVNIFKISFRYIVVQMIKFLLISITMNMTRIFKT